VGGRRGKIQALSVGGGGGGGATGKERRKFTALV